METTDPVNKIIVGSEVFWEYQGDKYPDMCRCGNAQAHIAEKAKQFCTGAGLDIGAGNFPFGSAFPVSNSGVNAHNLYCFVDESLDYIFSSHCLEHLDKPFEALKLWETKLKPGGVMFLYLPHPDMKLWKPGSPWVKAAHKWQPTYEILAGWFENLGLKIISGSPDQDSFYSFHIAGRKNG